MWGFTGLMRYLLPLPNQQCQITGKISCKRTSTRGKVSHIFEKKLLCYLHWHKAFTEMKSVSGLPVIMLFLDTLHIFLDSWYIRLFQLSLVNWSGQLLIVQYMKSVQPGYCLGWYDAKDVDLTNIKKCIFLIFVWKHLLILWHVLSVFISLLSDDYLP